MAVAPKRRPADRAAGSVVSTVEPLESRQFLSVAPTARDGWGGEPSLNARAHAPSGGAGRPVLERPRAARGLEHF